LLGEGGSRGGFLISPGLFGVRFLYAASFRCSRLLLLQPRAFLLDILCAGLNEPDKAPIARSNPFLRQSCGGEVVPACETLLNLRIDLRPLSFGALYYRTSDEAADNIADDPSGVVLGGGAGQGQAEQQRQTQHGRMSQELGSHNAPPEPECPAVAVRRLITRLARAIAER
jgi:hypothetical protein